MEPSSGRGQASNDCRNCQRRGLRCSQTHPACHQCLRKGLHCRFLLSRAGASAWRTTSITTNTPASPPIQSTSSAFTPVDIEQRTSLSNGCVTAPTTARQQAQPPPVPATLSILPFKDNVQLSWLHWHYTHRPAMQHILVASSSNAFGAPAMSAAVAASTTMFARMHNQPAQTPYSREYASAVQALTTHLPSFDVARLEEVVIPALLLLTAESWLSGRSREHSSGLEQLVRLSGQALFQQCRFHLFHEVRNAMVWQAMAYGERTIFGEEWWKIAPFALLPSSKSPSDHLVDYMADIAGLLGDAKEAPTAVQEPPSVDLEYRARAILHQLYSWRWSWLARNPRGVFEAEAEAASPFGTVLRYTNPQLMYEIWLCDALVIIILGFLEPQQLQSRPTAPMRVTGSLWKPDQDLSIQQAAIEICRSFEYHLENLVAPASVHQWAMPPALAYVSVSPTDPIAVWVYAKILAAPANRSMPWRSYIKRLKGVDQDADGYLFACWPINRS